MKNRIKRIAIRMRRKIKNKIKRILNIFSYFVKYWGKYLIPVKPNLIVFMTNSFNYTCNPKYICERLLESNCNVEIVWLTNGDIKKKASFPTNVTIVHYKSMKGFYYVSSAKMWISNGVDFANYFDKKKNQIKIQTMHGSLGIKKLDNAILARNRRGLYGRLIVKRETRDTDLVITNSLFEENVFRTVFWKNTPMKRLGHARTDILFVDDMYIYKYIKQRICETYQIPYDKEFVLYGPTHRTGLTYEDISFDYEKLINCLKQKFNKEYVILYRLHDRNRKLIRGLQNRKLIHNWASKLVYDVSDYPDIQELMLISDIAITDYSSWIFDYIVTKKKGFIFAKDLQRYNNITGLYYTLEETPFLVAYNENDLFNNIMNFDKDVYKHKVEAFLQDKEAVDDGKSSERIVDEICKLLKI